MTALHSFSLHVKLYIERTTCTPSIRFKKLIIMNYIISITHILQPLNIYTYLL